MSSSLAGAVLITGASGFVGASLASTLAGEGVRVVSLVRDWTGPPPSGVTVRGDVTDYDLCRRILADYEIDCIYHLAAQSIVSACAEDPLTALEVAVLGTGRLLQAARVAGRPIRTVVSTSDKVYGEAPAPYDERTPLRARHAYEVSKACQDLVARMFHSNYGVDVVVVRAVNIYGPGDPNESRLIPRTILRLHRGELPLLHAGSGEMKRQYVYIDDFVRALRIIRDRGKPGEAYCVGSLDAPMSVLDVMRSITQQAGWEWAPPEVRGRDHRFQEIQEQSVNDTKLRGLGWNPSVTFADGVGRTVAWYRDRNRDPAMSSGTKD